MVCLFNLQSFFLLLGDFCRNDPNWEERMRVAFILYEHRTLSKITFSPFSRFLFFPQMALLSPYLA